MTGKACFIRINNYVQVKQTYNHEKKSLSGPHPNQDNVLNAGYDHICLFFDHYKISKYQYCIPIKKLAQISYRTDFFMEIDDA